MNGLSLAIDALQLMKRTRFGCCCACGCDVWLKPEQRYFASWSCLWRFKAEMRALSKGEVHA